MRPSFLSLDDIERVSKLAPLGLAPMAEALSVSDQTVRRFCRKHGIEYATPECPTEAAIAANRQRAEEAKAAKAEAEQDLAADTKRKKSDLFAFSPAIATRLEEEAGKAIKAWARKHGHMKAFPPKPMELSDDRRKEQVIRFIERHGPSTVRDIVRCSGVPRTQVYVAAAELARQGVLRIAKEGKNGNTLRYHLAQKSGISARQQRRLDVLCAMVDAKPAGAAEIARKLGLHRTQVRDVLNIAIRDGEAVKESDNGWPVYRLTHKGLAAISIQAEAA